jgi:16S rRNA (cytidine1402-2'-O)-methyltransferase
MPSGKLFIIPNTLGELAPIETLPSSTVRIVLRLRYWIVETPKPARRFLRLAGVETNLRALDIQVLDQNTPETRLPALIEPALRGNDLGILSDAGCPAVADPGAKLVALAHEHHISVCPLVGPSSILLALMGSGLNGQQFVFHGYLPVDAAACIARLKVLEKTARAHAETQIFIETPYRNERLLKNILRACSPRSRLCIATDLTLPSQSIRTLTIEQWREQRPALDKRPSVFLLTAG